MRKTNRPFSSKVWTRWGAVRCPDACLAGRCVKEQHDRGGCVILTAGPPATRCLCMAPNCHFHFRYSPQYVACAPRVPVQRKRFTSPIDQPTGQVWYTRHQASVSARSHLRSELAGPRSPGPGNSSSIGIYRFTEKSSPPGGAPPRQPKICLNVLGPLPDCGGSACFPQDEWGGGESYSTSASRVFAPRFSQSVCKY